MPKTINDIIPPSRRRALGQDPVPTISLPPRPRPVQKSSGGFPVKLAIVALIVVIVSVVLMFVFTKAEIHIVPTTLESPISQSFTATLGTGDLPYEVVTIEKMGSKSVQAEGTEETEEAAQGTITIMNKQSTPQQLVTKTRFQSPQGHIYQIQESVTVPKGSEAAPGILSVRVTSQLTGDKYNIGPATFTVPGLKGSEAFELVTAVSEEPMRGGFSGTRASIKDSTREATRATIIEGLEKELESELATQTREGYIAIPGGSFVTYEDEPDEASAGTVSVQVKGVMRTVLFKNEALGSAIAAKVAGSYQGEPVVLYDVSGLSIQAENPPVAEEFEFALTGNAKLLWVVDADRIIGEVAGKKRDLARVMLNNLPEISQSKLVLRPFWTSSFPEDPTNIKVKVEVVD